LINEPWEVPPRSRGLLCPNHDLFFPLLVFPARNGRLSPSDWHALNHPHSRCCSGRRLSGFCGRRAPWRLVRGRQRAPCFEWRFFGSRGRAWWGFLRLHPSCLKQVFPLHPKAARIIPSAPGPRARRYETIGGRWGARLSFRLISCRQWQRSPLTVGFVERSWTGARERRGEDRSLILPPSTEKTVKPW